MSVELVEDAVKVPRDCELLEDGGKEAGRSRKRRVGGPRRRKAPSKACYLTLAHLDGRSEASKRAHQLIETLERERGGPDHITEGQKQLCQRAGVLAAVIENMESLWVAGEAIDFATYLSAIGVQRRVLLSLGLERQAPRDVTPPLSTYLNTRDADDSEANP
jgi:hypothetical protein